MPAPPEFIPLGLFAVGSEGGRGDGRSDRRLPSPPDGRRRLIEIDLLCGDRMRVDGDFDKRALRRVLKVLKQVAACRPRKAEGRACQTGSSPRCGGRAVCRMIQFATGTKVYLACRPVSMRYGFDGLSAKVANVLRADPFSRHLFPFRSKRGDYLKILYRDGSGFCLSAERLVKGHFVWPPVVDSILNLTRAQRAIVIEAIDWCRTVPPPFTGPADSSLISTFNRLESNGFLALAYQTC